MKFTIITPTLQRESLRKTCASVNEQTFTDWEHLVVVDLPEPNMDMILELAHPKRHFLFCGTRYRDGGNTPRRMAYKHATGDFLYYLDDDNQLCSLDALERVAARLKGPVDFFPILRLGHRFFPPDPPRSCHVDTANLVVERSIGEWPDTNAYGSDGILVESLVSKYPYHLHPDMEPIAVLPVINGAR